MEVTARKVTALTKALDKVMDIDPLIADVSSWETPHGWMVKVEWTGPDERPAGRTLLELRKDRTCAFGDLTLADAYQASGVFGQMIERMRAPLVKAGVEVVIALPGGPESERALCRGGFVWEQGRLVCHIAVKGNRMDEYAAWKRGDADRPGWHRDLGA